MKDFDLLKVLGTGGKWIWFQNHYWSKTNSHHESMKYLFSQSVKGQTTVHFFTCSNFKIILLLFNQGLNDSTQSDWYMIVCVWSAKDCGMLFTYNEQHSLFDTLCHIVKFRIRF